MSWSLRRSAQNEEDIESLEKEIRRAAEAKIIMYCAAEDQFQYGGDQKILPGDSDTRAIKTVGSAREGGDKSDFVNVDQVKYLIPGEEVLPDSKKEGSSAATALAAGVAALVLWCFEVTPGSEGMAAMANPKRMDQLFRHLQGNKGGKWVNVTRLLRNPQSGPQSIVEACSKWVEGIEYSKKYKEEPSSNTTRRGSVLNPTRT